MTYDDFKNFVIVHLWKMGDQVVINALDTLIQLAQSELNRTFKVEDRAVVAMLEQTSNAVVMPEDVRTIRNVHIQDFGDFSYVPPSDFYAQQDAAQGQPLGVYTTVGKSIVLSINSDVNNPRTLTLTYWANIPDYKTTGESWLADDYLDVYLYCVLKHTAPFLREDERVPMWQEMFSDAFGSAMLENDENRYAGSPLQMKFDYVG